MGDRGSGHARERARGEPFLQPQLSVFVGEHLFVYVVGRELRGGVGRDADDVDAVTLPEGQNTLLAVNLHERLPDAGVRGGGDSRTLHRLHLEQQLDPVERRRRGSRDDARGAARRSLAGAHGDRVHAVHHAPGSALIRGESGGMSRRRGGGHRRGGEAGRRRPNTQNPWASRKRG